MAIGFKHGGVPYTADTPEEAAKFVALLRQQDAEEATKRAYNRATIAFGGPGAMTQQIVEHFGAAPWTPDVFLRFIERLGASQQKALSMLVTRRRVADDELRDALGTRGNQALAGVLSGISKQAAALDIPARDVFSFENIRSAGKRRSIYSVADKVLRIATEMNWPVVPQE
jgi:hypothetical protein